MATSVRPEPDNLPRPPDPRWGAPTGARTPGDRVYFPGLDGLRAVAIALVYVFHDRHLNLLDHLVQWASVPLALLVDPLLRRVGLPETSWRLRGLVSPFRENGWIGVQIFFVLSGYLITTLLLRERERFGRVDLPAFWARRILRIWPLYYLVVVICFLLIPLARAAVGIGAGDWWGLVADRMPAFLAFLGNWSMALRGPIPSDSISVLWSVCVEEQFYLFVPLLVAWIGPRWRIPTVVALMAASVAARYAMAASGLGGVSLRYNTVANLDTLLAGVLLAIVTRRWPGTGRGSPWPLRSAVIVGGMLIYAIRLGHGPPWRQAADFVLIWAWSAAVVAWAATDRDRWSGFLRRHWLVWLGRISYGLYLYHEIAIGLVSWAAPLLPSFPEDRLLMALMGPTLTIALASASYYGFERPFLRLKRRWTRIPSRPIDGREEAPSCIIEADDGTMADRPDEAIPTSGGTSKPSQP